MKVRIKVTAIKCPSCEGTGKFMSQDGIPCMWCKGTKKLNRKDSLHYADHLWMLAGGGYIAGDHDYKYMREMEAESDVIRAYFRLPSLSSKKINS